MTVEKECLQNYCILEDGRKLKNDIIDKSPNN